MRSDFAVITELLSRKLSYPSPSEIFVRSGGGGGDGVLPLPTAVLTAAVAAPNADIDDDDDDECITTGKGADEAEEGEFEPSHCHT